MDCFFSCIILPSNSMAMSDKRTLLISAWLTVREASVVPPVLNVSMGGKGLAS